MGCSGGMPLSPGSLIRTLAGLNFCRRPLSQDCYILDQGGHKIFVWKGKNSNKEEKQQAMSRALVSFWGWLGLGIAAPWEGPGTPNPCPGSGSPQGFIKAKNYPSSTSVETENDGSESAVFRQLFQKWTVPSQSSGLGKTHTVGKVGECPRGPVPQDAPGRAGGARGWRGRSPRPRLSPRASLQPRWSR